MTLALLASSSSTWSHLLVLIEDFSNAVLYAIKKLIGLLIRNMWHGFEDSVLWNLISKIAELQVLEYSFLLKKKEKKTWEHMLAVSSQEVEGSQSLTAHSRPVWRIHYVVTARAT